MKKIRMKGKNVDEAVKAALEVLGGEKERLRLMLYLRASLECWV